MIQKESVNQLHSISLSLQGLVVGIIIVFPALLSLDIWGRHIALGFLPIAIVFLWPHAASYSWSLFCIFLIGLFYDMISASPLGMWALTLLILYVVLGGGIKHTGGLGRAVAGFGLCVFLCLIIVLILGKFSLGQWPRFDTLLLNALASLAVFPIIYWIRNLILAIRGQSESLGLRQ